MFDDHYAKWISKAPAMAKLASEALSRSRPISPFNKPN